MSELTDADRSTLRRLTEEDWVEACLASEWDRCVSLCSDDVDYMLPDSPALRGRDELRGFLEEFPTIIGFSQSAKRVAGDGDQAVVRGTFSVTVDGEEGEATGNGKFLSMAERRGDDWAFTTVCFNWDAPFG